MTLALDIARSFAALGPSGRDALDLALNQLSITELAALMYDWEGVWARPAQLVDLSDLRSHGFLAGRRFGKTRADIELVVKEVMEGRAPRVGFCAQNETKTVEVLVHGDCGFLAVSPPWFKARWELDRVIWPNGAQAFPFTPEVPGAIRGPGVHLFLATELQSWPAVHAFEAFYNAMLMTSLGAARFLWEATPKRGNPLIRMLLQRATDHPDIHRVTRGKLSDNKANLGAGVAEELERALAGTQRGREELDGEQCDDDDDALWKTAWIDAHRIPMPARSDILRRIITIDPAISTGDESDSTGMGELALLDDDRVLVIDDMTGKHEAHAWGKLALDRYVMNGCDLIVAELNRGGNLVTQNLRAAAKERGLRIEVVDPSWRPHRTPGAVYVREIHSKGSKGRRAAPVATYYQRGKVSHLRGANLATLETLQTTWVPPPEGTRAGSRRSPDALDACVMGVVELAGLNLTTPSDARAGFVGIDKLAQELRGGRSVADVAGLASALPRSTWGRRL